MNSSLHPVTHVNYQIAIVRNTCSAFSNFTWVTNLLIEPLAGRLSILYSTSKSN